MRNNLKHLALGMSLGAVVVFVYGVNKLTPTTNIGQECKTACPIENISESEDIIPQVADLVSWEIETQVQFIESNNLTSPIITDNTKGRNHNAPLTPTPTLQPTPTKLTKTVAVASIENNTQQNQNMETTNVIGLIEKYAAEYGVDKNMMIGIAKCESGFRENAVNGPYAGIYQFVSGTWISNRRAMGLDENLDLRYNAEESIKTAAFKMSRDGFGAWPVCQYKAQGLVASAQ